MASSKVQELYTLYSSSGNCNRSNVDNPTRVMGIIAAIPRNIRVSAGLHSSSEVPLQSPNKTKANAKVA